MFEITLTKLWLEESWEFSRLSPAQAVFGDLRVTVDGKTVPGMERVRDSHCSLARWSRGLIELVEMEEFASRWNVDSGDPAFNRWEFIQRDEDESLVDLTSLDLTKSGDDQVLMTATVPLAEVVQASKKYRKHFQALLLEYAPQENAHRWYMSATNKFWNYE